MLGNNEGRAVAAIQIRAECGSSEFVIESEKKGKRPRNRVGKE